MNEKELGEALLHWAAPGLPAPGDPGQLVRQVLTRDRRRVRTLATVTIVLWVIASAGIPLFFAAFMAFIFPKVEEVLREIITHHRGLGPEQLSDIAHQLLLMATKLSILLVTGSVAALLLAACGTVALVFAARRSTLRQVNANLVEIAEQLKRSHPAPR